MVRWSHSRWKWWFPQIIHFNGVFHDKPSIFGYHYFRKPPSLRNKKTKPNKTNSSVFGSKTSRSGWDEGSFKPLIKHFMTEATVVRPWFHRHVDFVGRCFFCGLKCWKNKPNQTKPNQNKTKQTNKQTNKQTKQTNN